MSAVSVPDEGNALLKQELGKLFGSYIRRELFLLGERIRGRSAQEQKENLRRDTVNKNGRNKRYWTSKGRCPIKFITVDDT